VTGDDQAISIGPRASEAQLYDNLTFTALTETLDDIRTAIEAGGVLVAKLGERIVGAVRG
jgi:hypothetical protein